jgi:hypothetical protein
MAPNPTIYCLEQLTDYAEFERLCDDLMALEGYPEIEPLGGFKDKGRDAVHVSAHDGKATIFAYSVREAWRAKLAEDAGKIHLHDHDCNRMVFITTSAVTAGERDEAISFIEKQYGWELVLYPVERLRILLETTHPQVRANHPQIFPPSVLEALDRATRAEQHDHILVHYAPEDRAAAEWLARKLTAEGYLVWCEHLRHLGGERYPENIDEAIQNRAGCLVALYSRSSLANPDLVRQRAVALSFDHQHPHFFVPLRLDPIPIEGMDQITRQLVFVPFEKDWAEGLRRLLERLETSDCPKILPNGQGLASITFSKDEILSPEPEQLISNCLQVLELPRIIFGFTPAQPVPSERLAELKQAWAFRSERDGVYLSFHHPPDELAQTFQFQQSGSWSWSQRTSVKNISPANLVSELIRKCLAVACYRKGLLYCQDTHMVYFPFGLVEGDKIRYQWPNEKHSWINTTGERKYPSGKKEYYRYHLSPDFWVSQYLGDDFTVLLRVRVRITDISGVPLPSRPSLSRRKALAKDWWNGEWLSRMLAICQFLSDGDTISIGTKKTEQVIVSSIPITVTSTRGINEDALSPDYSAREDMLYLQDDEEDGQTEGAETLE